MDGKNDGKAHFEKTAVVAFGQAAGFLFSFFIPVFLSRRLSIDSYGTYKQIFLIQGFFLLTLQMGLDSGIFYFMKRDPRSSPLFSLNAVFIESLLALLVAATLVLFRAPLAHLFHNPELAELIPALAALILFSIPSQPLEHYLMVLDKVRYSVLAFTATALLKALVVLGGYLFLDSLKAVVFGLAAIGLLRCLLLVGWNLYSLRRDKIPLASAWTYLPDQLAFGLPIGFSQLVSVLCKMDRFVIAGLFTVRQFTLYSVGALELPVIPGISNTMSDLMSFDMVEANTRRDFGRIKYLWHTTKRKTALIQIPIAVYLMFFAGPLITFVYSDKYAESAPYFRLFMLIFLVSTFDCDILFRTFADNRRFLKIQFLSSLGGLAMTIAFACAFGPMGALVGKCVAETASVAAKLTLARGLLRLRVADLFLWSEISKIGAASVISAVGARLVFRNTVFTTPVLGILLSLAVFGLIFGGLALVIGILKPDETAYLRGRAAAALRLNQVRRPGAAPISA